MLLWNTVEVGRNDAANLVNAVYGARLMTRQRAVRIAGIATVIGAMLSSGVIETARKGIFKPSLLTPEQAVAVYVSVYVVATVLLYGYSAFGMPVSTTACLVFGLLGGSLAMSMIQDHPGTVQWNKAGTVVSAIVISIFLSGFTSFLIQRLVRGAIRDRSTDLRTMRTHGTWIGGGMATGLVFFLILKGAKHAWGIRSLESQIDRLDEWVKSVLWGHGEVVEGAAEVVAGAGPGFNIGMAVVLLGLWLLFGVLIHVLLDYWKERAARSIFPALTILGMIAMAIAFGQNDLANCASPGLSTITLVFHWDKGISEATQIPIAGWMLFTCGVLLFLGMRTKNATRVTEAEVRMGSQTDRVELYAPRWCIALGQVFMAGRRREVALAPRPMYTPKGQRTHYDPLRACTIMCVSASVIALASSYKLPVSTTYVAFAAVVGTGMGDKIFQRGDAALKLARAMWVGISWFAAAAIAAIFTGVVCMIVYHLGVPGLIVTVCANLYLRRMLSRRGDDQARRVREEMLERSFPDRFATEEE